MENEKYGTHEFCFLSTGCLCQSKENGGKWWRALDEFRRKRRRNKMTQTGQKYVDVESDGPYDSDEFDSEFQNGDECAEGVKCNSSCTFHCHERGSGGKSRLRSRRRVEEDLITAESAAGASAGRPAGKGRGGKDLNDNDLADASFLEGAILEEGEWEEEDGGESARIAEVTRTIKDFVEGEQIITHDVEEETVTTIKG